MKRYALLAGALLMAACSGATRTDTKLDAGPPPPPPPPKLAEVLQMVRSHESANDPWTPTLCSEITPKLDVALSLETGISKDDLYKSAQVYEACHDASKAIAQYKHAVEAAGGAWCAATVQLATLEVAGDRLDSGLDVLEATLAKEPQCVEAVVNHAALLRQRAQGDDLTKARAALAGFLLAHPEEPAALNELIENLLSPKGPATNVETAWSLASRARSVANATSNAPMAARLLTTMGRVALRRNEPRPASVFFADALAKDPHAVAAAVALGNTRLQLTDAVGAQAAFDKALDVEPNNYDALVGRGAAFRVQAETEIQTMRRGAATPPADASSPFAEKALADAERAMQISPERPEAHYNFAIAYERVVHPFASDRSEDLNKAKEHFRAFLEHAGSDARWAAAVSHAHAVVDAAQPSSAPPATTP